MNRRVMLPGLVAAVMLLVAGCASGGPQTRQSVAGVSQEPHLTVVATDQLKFEPATLSVKAGEPVQVHLDNPGALPHDFTIVGMPAKDIRNDVHEHMGHGAEPGTVMGDLPAAHQAEVGFTATQAGKYEFYCSVPGHKEAGMKGTLLVE